MYFEKPYDIIKSDRGYGAVKNRINGKGMGENPVPLFPFAVLNYQHISYNLQAEKRMYWVDIEEDYLSYLRDFEKRIPFSDYGADRYKPFFGVFLQETGSVM
ncbi:MAG: hypothetical protein HFG75_11955 [Hungatella sp.]|nr:hypothetical protein [Hungatella sp.]